MHGYEFFLMATGYAKYIDGKIIGDNEDIACEEGTLCPWVTYDEQVLKEQRQARTSFIAKNAILVPPQGYAIVRFRASNPGIWPLHCHQGAHLFGGMSALVEIKDDLENRPFSYLPEDFPRCGNYNPNSLPKMKEEEENAGSAALITLPSLIFFLSQILMI